MNNDTDPVDGVILAFLDYLEGAAGRPSLDHLSASDRDRAQRLIESLEAGRGIDPHASRPSVEALLADTELAPLLFSTGSHTAEIDVTTLKDVLSAIDERAQVEVHPGTTDGPTVGYSYLDLHARFVLVDADTPVVTGEVRALVRKLLFETDPETVRVGVVARTDELLTQMLSADDLGVTITAPLGQPHAGWQSPLPLALAVRRMLEQGAPEWDPFDFDRTTSDRLDVGEIAAAVASRVIEREAARSYRGVKARAYRGLVGQERVFAELVAEVVARGVDAVDLDAETTRIAREAA